MPHRIYFTIKADARQAKTRWNCIVYILYIFIKKIKKIRKKTIYFSHKLCYNKIAEGEFIQPVLQRKLKGGIGMKVTVYGKQLNVRESLKTAVEKKLLKFDKFFGEDTEAFVTCRARKGVKILEITVNYNGTTFRSEQESETFITALDRAAEGLERQIRKNKTRIEKTVKRGAFDITEPDDDDEYEDCFQYSVVSPSHIYEPQLEVQEST